MLRTLVSFLIFLMPLAVIGQNSKTDGHIFWSSERPLTWDDFKAKAAKRHEASAMSDITFSISIKTEGKFLEIRVEPSFNPDGSWVKEENKEDELLKHEQVHFDISEVNARKLRMELQTKKITSANANSVLGNLVEKYSQLNEKIQVKYDAETKHSLDKEKQEEWNEEIAKELKELASYSEASFRVAIQ